MNEKVKTNDSMNRLWDSIAAFFKLVFACGVEFVNAAKTRTVPVTNCFIPTLVFSIVNLIHLDRRIFEAWGVGPFYLRNGFLFWSYYLFSSTLGFWGWALIRVARTRRITRRLTQIFKGIGLKNSVGEIPAFVFDIPVDEVNRRLRLNRNFISKEEFLQKEKSISGGLQIYIEEIEEIREDGTIDILYSTVEMPKIFKINNIKDFPNFTFLIGRGRSKDLRGDLKKNPHLLIAGETDGGKSTFLRQLIATIYLNNDNAEFLLIDLKGNLEFQFFENVKRILVCQDVPVAVVELKRFTKKLEERFSDIKTAGAKDFEHYEKIRAEKRNSSIPGQVIPKALPRIIIAIDEAADLFLVSEKTKSVEARNAREVLSQIARKGRALGIHLIFSTQRPDVNAVSPQIKSNLSAILAYKIGNAASSMTILDNGRAALLPKIPGRAIWKVGGQMSEVQTPFLDVPSLEKLFEPFKETQELKYESRETQNKTQSKRDLGIPDENDNESVSS